MKEYPRILFMGTPEIASYILKGLIENEYNIIGVIAQEDKPEKKKKIIEPVPTKKVAMEYGIPCFQPKKIRLEYEFVKELKPDLIITCAYGQLIPQELIDIIGYDPVVHLDLNHANDQILDILEHIDEYQKLVDKNREMALKHGDWKQRIHQMMEVLEKLGYKCK